MKVQLINTQNPVFSPIEQVLYNRNISYSDFNKFLNLDSNFRHDPKLLKNIETGAKLLLQHLNNKSRIYMIVDSDCDGYTSSAALSLYIKQICKDININYIIHEGKQHGIYEEIPDCDLLIIPDASSEEVEKHIELSKRNIDILILDHHIYNPEIRSSAIIINSQDGQYPNDQLSGVGVVYQFCRYLDQLLNINFSEDIIDLVALGMIGDMMSLSSLETLSIINKGLHNINNKLFQAIIEKQSYSLKEITPISIAFYVVPLINATIRMGTEEEKTTVFTAFIEPDRQVLSTKKGTTNEKESIVTQAVRYMTNCKNRQNTAVKKALERIDCDIATKGLLKNSILTILLEDNDVNKKIIGLIANKLASKYQRPTLVLSSSIEEAIGSGRNYANSEIEDFRQFLLNTDLFNFCSGHENAFGASINIDKISSFIENTNQKLANINFEYKFKTDFEFEKECPPEIIFILNRYKYLYGQGIFEPMIYVKNIPIDQYNISLLGKNKDTLKINNGKVDFLKFFLNNYDKDIFENIIFNNLKGTIDIVGRGNINTFYSQQTAQIIIEDFEINI